MENKWFAVRTFVGYEQKVKDSLNKQIVAENMENLITAVYIPIMKRYKFTRGKLKLKEELLYPGYIFVQMKDTNENIFFVRGVQYVTGYAGISSMKERPEAMDDGEVEEMKKQVENVGIELSVGDSIKVVNHEIYDGLVVKIARIDIENQKVEIFIDTIFGDDQKTAEVSFLQIEKAK